MSEIVIHQRVFEKSEKVLEFDTAIDVFKVIHIGMYYGQLAVWYETLKNPVYRRSVRLELVYTNQYVPDNGLHIGSTMFGNDMVHCYKIMKRV